MTLTRRVVVTGVGAISCCGLDAPSSWASVLAGRSGVGPITRFDATEFASRIAGEVRGFDPEKFIEKKRVREGDRFIHFAIAAADECVKQSGLVVDARNRDRIGTFIGVGMCGLETLENTARTLFEKGPRRISPYFIPATIANLAPGQVSMRLGFRGPNHTTTSACASATHSIGEAFKWIVRGGIDAAIAGGSEAAITGLGVGGFAAMRALSTRNEDPSGASRPFDRDRDGFVIAEGAGLLMLEEYEFARARGAKIFAELVGYGASGDAYHLTQPAPEGEGAQRAMKMALADAAMSPDEVDYINAHATGTPRGDVLELQAVRAVFGGRVADKQLPISSTKGATGHLLGAAGGIEAVFSVLSLTHQVVPPNCNLVEPDPECAFADLVTGTARKKTLRAVMSNSFGFGGTNATLLFRAVN